LKQFLPDGEQSLKERGIRLIFVPHEVDSTALELVEHQLQELGMNSVRYTRLMDNPIPTVLIVDKVGILADLYAHSHLAYIGAGFGAGVHSVIEPAVHNNAVVFGPNYYILDEAVALVEEKLGFVIHTGPELAEILELIGKPAELDELAGRLSEFTHRHAGASERVVTYLFGDS